MYLDSSNVKVFPFAKFRGETDISSRLFYEDNISRLIRQIVDTEGFIVSGGITSTGDTSQEGLAINIHGYYFYITKETSVVPSKTSTTCYASVKLTDGAISELSGQDDSGKFTVLNLTDTVPEDANVFYIKLAEKTTTGWTINNELKRKFNFGYSAIDGKH